MDSTTTMLIIGGVAVAAFLGGFLCKPIGLCPGGSITAPTITGQYNKTGTAIQNRSNTLASAINSPGGPFTQAPESNVAYSYVGYSSAPLTVA